MKENRNNFDRFIREGRAVSFTDDQLDFLWDWICLSLEDPEAFTHLDNYTS